MAMIHRTDDTRAYAFYYKQTRFAIKGRKIQSSNENLSNFCGIHIVSSHFSRVCASLSLWVSSFILNDLSTCTATMRSFYLGDQVFTEQRLIEMLRKQEEMANLHYIALHLLMFSMLMSINFVTGFHGGMHPFLDYGEVLIYVRDTSFTIKIDILFFLLLVWCLFLLCFFMHRLVRYFWIKKNIKKGYLFRLAFVPVDGSKVVTINKTKYVKKFNNNPTLSKESCVIDVQNV